MSDSDKDSSIFRCTYHIGLCRGNSFDMLNRPLKSCSNKLSSSLVCTRCELEKLFHFSDGCLTFKYVHLKQTTYIVAQNVAQLSVES